MVSPVQALPLPHQLAALGAVLCLYRPRGGELAGWAQAVRSASRSEIDGDGVHESLVFFDAHGQPCWQLHLLPETDFLAWDRLAHRLPQHCEAPARAHLGARLWRRYAERGGWRLEAMRLHALPPAPGFASLDVLAASPAPLSAVGAEAARRIARSHGIDAGGAIDDCCCRRAARATEVRHDHDAGYPLIRFHRAERA